VHAGGDDRSPLAGLSGFTYDVTYLFRMQKWVCGVDALFIVLLHDRVDSSTLCYATVGQSQQLRNSCSVTDLPSGVQS